MAFSIGYDIGPWGVVLLALIAVPAVMVLAMYLMTVRQAQRSVVEQEEDEGGSPPVA